MGAVKWNGAERTETDDGIIIKTHREFTGTSWDDLMEIPTDTCLQGSAFYNITVGKAAFWDGSENWVETDGTEHSGIPPVWKIYVASSDAPADGVYVDNNGVAYYEGEVRVVTAVPDEYDDSGWYTGDPLDALTCDNPNIAISDPHERRPYHLVEMNGELGHFEATHEGNKKTFTISPYGVCSVDGVQAYYLEGAQIDWVHDTIPITKYNGNNFVFKDGDEYLSDFVAKVSDEELLTTYVYDEEGGIKSLDIVCTKNSAHDDATVTVMFRDKGCAVTLNVRVDID